MKKARYKAVVIVIIILFLAAVFVYFRPPKNRSKASSICFSSIHIEEPFLLFWFQMDLYLKQENSWSIFLCMRIQNLSVL